MREKNLPQLAATMSYDPNLPFCCIECAQLYTITYYQQSLETFLLQSHNDNLSEELELEQNNTNVDPIAPIPVNSPVAGSSKTSKSVTRGPRHTIPETMRLNVSRNNRDDPSITTSVSTRSPRNPRKSGEREPKNVIEYNLLTSDSSVPAQDRSPSNRGHNRENPRETGAANKPRTRKHDDLPPIPTQDNNSPSNGGPQLQHPQETQGSYSIDKPQARTGPLSIPSDRTDERNQLESNDAEIRPHTQESRETQVSFSNKPLDSDLVEPPSVVIQEKIRPNFSPIRPQTQRPRETRVSFNANKPKDSDHIEPPSVPIQGKSQFNLSQTHPQSQETQSNIPQDSIEPPSVPIQEKSQSNLQETQASSNVNKSRDSTERPKAQDQSQDRSASNASKADTRPHLMHGTPSQMDTQYVNMLLALDDIPKLHNILAKFFNWILLAGFVLFPGTFTSLKNLGGSGQVEQQLVNAVTSIPL